MVDTTTARIIVEVVSAIICFILVRFMIKPYWLTREGRYLGLPLGFGFLGASYVLSGLTFSQPYYSLAVLSWLQLLVRTFAFVFLATTYYFSKKPSKNTRLLWDVTLSLLAVALFTLILLLFNASQSSLENYDNAQVYIRVFNVFCLFYVAIHTLRSHIRKPDPATIWIPLGFILLGISQYSLLFFYIDRSLAAFTGALVIRLMALAVFLSVSYRTFYGPEKKMDT
jgi:hypothetical protein